MKLLRLKRVFLLLMKKRKNGRRNWRTGRSCLVRRKGIFEGVSVRLKRGRGEKKKEKDHGKKKENAVVLI